MSEITPAIPNAVMVNVRGSGAGNGVVGVFTAVEFRIVSRENRVSLSTAQVRIAEVSTVKFQWPRYGSNVVAVIWISRASQGTGARCNVTLFTPFPYQDIVSRKSRAGPSSTRYSVVTCENPGVNQNLSWAPVQSLSGLQSPPVRRVREIRALRLLRYRLPSYRGTGNRPAHPAGMDDDF